MSIGPAVDGVTSAPSPVLGRRCAVVNLVAQGGALAVVSASSVIVARSGGAAIVGDYTLLRVLPWLTAVLFSSGLPVASTYFLGLNRPEPVLRWTLATMAVLGAAVGALAWVCVVPALHSMFFGAVPVVLLYLVACSVMTQLLTVWAKACCQGAADMRGANMIIVCEELVFLPAYGATLASGLRGITAIVIAMVVGGIAATAIALGRLLSQGFFATWARPCLPVARSVLKFGSRAQLGNLLWLVNLRLDFLMLGVLAGPATLGVYAVASKFAELMRLPATALNYVLYPRFTRLPPGAAAREARRLTVQACTATMLAAPVLAVAAVVALPRLFGDGFESAVVPACILLVGLAVEGATAVGSAYLWGAGRPGANSIGMGLGVIITVALDLLLIPQHGAVGAAIASSIAYLATAVFITALAGSCAARAIDSAIRTPSTGVQA
ncbi:MAG: polysaccharide biosynthesis C-terminal domain-containing protein [Actinomycetota bacterium]|nr:polysaccharide biosynthesis C-terminal domain-containing protein [Actinomycetota bacterium]